MHVIRKATKEDAQEIFTLRNDSIRSELVGHYPAEIISLWTAGETPSDRFCKTVKGSFFVAEIEGAAIACGALDIVSGKLDAIFVSHKYLREGFGRKMLEFLERLAVEVGLPSLHLEATLNAEGFYQRLGYSSEGPSKYQSPRGFTMDCVVMHKRLNKGVRPCKTLE